MIYFPKLRHLPRLGLICAMAFAAVAAQADLKIVSKTTVSTKRGPVVVSIISFFKGSMIRVDDRDVSEITDSRTHKTTFINHTKRIYTVVSETQTSKTVAASIKSQHMKISAHIRPTGKKKMIVGKNASEYLGDLTISGDFPQQPGSTARAIIHLDEWTIPAAGISISQSAMLGTVGTLLQSLNNVGNMKQVTTELAKVKGIPLNINVSAVMTITTAGGGAPQTQNHTYVTEAQVVNEGPLPASAFAIPKGYTLVNPPKPGAAPAKPKKK
jgi:hypothetical protein